MVINMVELDMQKWNHSPARFEFLTKVDQLLLIAYPDVNEKARIMEILNTKLMYFDSPASTEYHGAELGGLVKHSLAVYKKLSQLANITPEIKIPEISIIRTTLFHDLCKCNVYKPNILAKGISQAKPFKYVDENPIGYHGDKSVLIAFQNGFNLTQLEQIMIRYHMGKYGQDCPDWFLDRVKETYPQVTLLSCADLIASTIEDLTESDKK